MKPLPPRPDGPPWKTRLWDALAASKASPRSISLRADQHERYISQVFTEDKEPGIEAFVRICDAMSVSPAYILRGADVTPEDERFLLMWRAATEKTRQAIQALLDP